MGLEMADFIKSKIIARLARYRHFMKQVMNEGKPKFSTVCKTTPIVHFNVAHRGRL